MSTVAEVVTDSTTVGRHERMARVRGSADVVKGISAGRVKMRLAAPEWSLERRTVYLALACGLAQVRKW